jgi:hypothetical protein
MDRGLDGVLSQMESPSGFDADIRDAPLRDLGRTVQRIVALLRDIDGEPDTARHRPRLKAIRDKLNQACRNRFGTGLEEGLAAPLTASTEPIAAVTQTEIETNARALRTLELAARKIGDPVVYDALLKKAADMVHSAANAGVLTKVRKMRLIEILAGPEAAEALYRQGG